MSRDFVRLQIRIWISTLLLAGVPALPAYAQTCVEAGGKIFCGSLVPKQWKVSGTCDEAAPSLFRDAAGCRASGGTPGPEGTCPGAQPLTEGNLLQRVIRFAEELRHNAVSCSIAGDTGWGAVFYSYNCGNYQDYYTEGQLSGTARRLSVACEGAGGELIYAGKYREFECPPGYGVAGHPNNNGIPMCARLIEDCEGGCINNVGSSTLGNPVMPLTGVKVESATDYRHASGLEFTRHYHSLRFSEPYSLAEGVHTENRLGVVWRSNFDKRVIPLVPNNLPPKHGISLPSGNVQYFDASGAEIYNYSGGAGSLVVVSGVGYYYRGPNSTEFYGTDGRLRTITQRSGLTLTLTYSDGTAGPNGGFIHDAAGNPTAAILPANRLIRVSDSYGNTLSFALNVLGHIVRMTDAGGAQYLYTYDSLENLTSVTFPDTRVRTYRYNEPANMVGGASLPSALTSIVDENTNVFASFKYDTTARVVSTEHAGQTQLYQLAYSTSTSGTSVTDPLGTVRSFARTPDIDGIVRLTGASQPGGAGYGVGVKQRTYDTAGNLASQTNYNDFKTCYAYLSGRNLETVRVEGVPAATACAGLLTAGAALPAGSRKVTTDWHARWRLPTRIAEPLRLTTFTYNGDSGASCAPGTATIDEGGASPLPIAVMCTRSMQATSDADGSQAFTATLVGTARASTFTYNATGQVLTVDAPRTDVSDVASYTYGTDGNVATITNAASHVTSITSYNSHGQPLTMVDPNGVTTTMVYDARRRLSSRTTGTETTSYDYDAVGQLTKVTLPDGSFLNYVYDPAHRLTEISDNLGNRITYSLDAMGNRTAEQVRDPANVLAQTRSREYSTLNRLFKEFGALSQTTEYGYDDQGNVTSVKDPLNRITSNQYDVLNRLKQVTDPGTGVTQYGYNGLDALTSVTDPRSLVTGYTVDGLGNLSQQASPDTGTTTNTYDAAGNLLTQTDAKSQTTAYTYDALNRVTQITFHDGSKQVYVYDQNTNGIGRLSSITERDPANAVTNQTSYAYDSHGRVAAIATAHGGVTHTLGYSYDSSGRLSGMTYPSGRTITYGFDALGRVNQVSTTKAGQTQTVVSGVAYHPFGGVKGYTLGNGQTYARSIDLDGRIASYTLGTKTFALGYDAASRIEFISDLLEPVNVNTYGYDALDRLTSATTPGVPYAYGYDAVGNRTSKTVSAATEAYTYSPTSNRIATVGTRSFNFDANGSTMADGNNTYAYDTRGRMVQATSVLGATNYKINALGQRIRKTNTLGDTVFHYDTSGKLIAETDPGGALKRELLYLGDTPVMVFQ